MSGVLSGKSSIGEWLEHPEGRPLIEELLAASGREPADLAPVSGLPLEQLVELSQGAFSREAVDDLVLRANGGVMPEVDAAASGWQERIVPGRFDGTTVIVTGAASGIGRATASRIAREGGRVVAADVNAAALDELGAELPGAVTVAGDIAQAADVDRIIAAAGERVDGLANVAGVMDDFSPLHELDDAVWERAFRVNVDGLMRLTRAVLPSMLAARSGSIVNVASEASLRGNAAGVAYTASKHAVVGITRNTAFMYGPSGIRVNAVAPGGVLTNISSSVEGMSEFGRERTGGFIGLMPPVATAAQLAASITFLLSDDGVNLNGAILPSDGGWSVQ
ncbi:SDR family NAD(P)-dependent oxidoreductase [Saccharopolyspora dendranthemae]|uniref:NADP-dependent 3-hydroxy acid dehydrogenase YdfG n=1 Tax=Saccharopolyspora dendranthemae TaxID=1181886 RepID=A0A561TZV5_9PSEU|nr:SDR family NAD(P)-dependent oxidoreductase [Saccharopolyspora dendranthemae]TWF92645.1 NADP-dependent 3-hydroxy acid dehydrogenase YdfG [Saccharopolyspora dendranthemae]